LIYVSFTLPFVVRWFRCRVYVHVWLLLRCVALFGFVFFFLFFFFFTFTLIYVYRYLVGYVLRLLVVGSAVTFGYVRYRSFTVWLVTLPFTFTFTGYVVTTLRCWFSCGYAYGCVDLYVVCLRSLLFARSVPFVVYRGYRLLRYHVWLPRLYLLFGSGSLRLLRWSFVGSTWLLLISQLVYGYCCVRLLFVVAFAFCCLRPVTVLRWLLICCYVCCYGYGWLRWLVTLLPLRLFVWLVLRCHVWLPFTLPVPHLRCLSLFAFGCRLLRLYVALAFSFVWAFVCHGVRSVARLRLRLRCLHVRWLRLHVTFFTFVGSCWFAVVRTFTFALRLRLRLRCPLRSRVTFPFTGDCYVPRVCPLRLPTLPRLFTFADLRLPLPFTFARLVYALLLVTLLITLVRLVVERLRTFVTLLVGWLVVVCCFWLAFSSLLPLLRLLICCYCVDFI